jgi:hypothetical protein
MGTKQLIGKSRVKSKNKNASPESSHARSRLPKGDRGELCGKPAHRTSQPIRIWQLRKAESGGGWRGSGTDVSFAGPQRTSTALLMHCVDLLEKEIS